MEILFALLQPCAVQAGGQIPTKGLAVCVVLCGFLPLASPPFNPVAAALPLAVPGSVVGGLAPRMCVRPRVRWALGVTS